MTQTQTFPTLPIQNDDAGKVVTDTVAANRASALASYLDACANLGIDPDPALKGELEAMTNYYCIDPADDEVLIEVASEKGNLGSYANEEPPALAGMTVEGLIHVTLTFQEGGKPSIGIQNLTEEDLPVFVHNSESAGSLYEGIITCS